MLLIGAPGLTGVGNVRVGGCAGRSAFAITPIMEFAALAADVVGAAGSVEPAGRMPNTAPAAGLRINSTELLVPV